LPIPLKERIVGEKEGDFRDKFMVGASTWEKPLMCPPFSRFFVTDPLLPWIASLLIGYFDSSQEPCNKFHDLQANKTSPKQIRKKLTKCSWIEIWHTLNCQIRNSLGLMSN
jgi:hypothetical protein